MMCIGPQVLTGLATASASSSTPAALRASVSKDTVLGLFRDLRGIAAATNSRRTYGGGRHACCTESCR